MCKDWSCSQKSINDVNAKVVITANEGVIGGQCLPLKATVDSAVKDTAVEVVLVAARTQTKVTMTPRDLSLDKEMSKAEATCPPEEMDSEDPLFIIYTSGTSDKSIGVMHTHAGYLLYAAVTQQCVFDYQLGDVFACIADLGWITGHSYVVYGPLCNGATTVLFESTHTYPHAGRYWDMVDRLKVNQFFTVPSVIRHLMKVGDELVTKYNLSSLKTIASTGEPLNEIAWKWYDEKVGRGRCHVVDAWWQTETGGIAITPLPQSESKPGFIMKPFFGVNGCQGEANSGQQCPGILVSQKASPRNGKNVNWKRVSGEIQESLL